jgi:hypothetical protein
LAKRSPGLHFVGIRWYTSWLNPTNFWSVLKGVHDESPPPIACTWHLSIYQPRICMVYFESWSIGVEHSFACRMFNGFWPTRGSGPTGFTRSHSDRTLLAARDISRRASLSTNLTACRWQRMSPMQVIVACTRDAACAAQVDDKLGTISARRSDRT